jgi:hypothetical protein
VAETFGLTTTAKMGLAWGVGSLIQSPTKDPLEIAGVALRESVISARLDENAMFAVR